MKLKVGEKYLVDCSEFPNAVYTFEIVARILYQHKIFYVGLKVADDVPYAVFFDERGRGDDPAGIADWRIYERSRSKTRWLLPEE